MVIMTCWTLTFQMFALRKWGKLTKKEDSVSSVKAPDFRCSFLFCWIEKKAQIFSNFLDLESMDTFIWLLLLCMERGSLCFDPKMSVFLIGTLLMKCCSLLLMQDHWLAWVFVFKISRNWLERSSRSDGCNQDELPQWDIRCPDRQRNSWRSPVLLWLRIGL